MATSNRKRIIAETVRTPQAGGRGRITEDDPRWIPGLMGNKRWGPGWRGPENYRKGRGRPD